MDVIVGMVPVMVDSSGITTIADDAAQESKSNYELGPAAPNGQMNGRDSYQTIQQRFQPPAAYVWASDIPISEADISLYFQ
ncbi:hypothetical protein PHLCEN_2v4760 [Hermanssonia centrifuga]|uniref:Uncharacterized protein n=1 Tax=Hermanssonia centrifuga TaxID=98765 RepID=A0A2R6PJD4_9APHY|nr:hypothetical protein PHLCEN_2v4760 [Hermanssonia centrifuga]